MKKLIIKVLGIILLVFFLIYLFYSPRLKFDVLENPNKGSKNNNSEQFKRNDLSSGSENPKPKEGVGTWVGKNISFLTHKYGQAERIYPVKNGYKNFVFKQSGAYYIVSAKENKIVSVYATGKDVNVSPIEIGERASEIFNDTSINPEPSFKVNGKTYEFELSDEDLKTQTLIKYGNIYAQVYSDLQSKKVLGVRFLNKEMLANLEPYQMSNEQEVEDNDDDQPIEQNPNQLITLYEVTNEMRKLRGLKPLAINKDISHIASNNLYEATSNGMESVEFTEDALKGQLDKNNIAYQNAAQNVGYDFNDVPTLIHSWMNSDTHRSRLLNSQYDEMGGEVMRGYYSLIFIEK